MPSPETLSVQNVPELDGAVGVLRSTAMCLLHHHAKSKAVRNFWNLPLYDIEG